MSYCCIRIGLYNIGITSYNSEMDSLYCNYLVDEQPDFCIDTNREDIEFEKKKYQEEHNKVCIYSDLLLEFLAQHRKTAHILMERGVYLVHGTAFMMDGKGFLILADSGVGKSTLAMKWKLAYKDRMKYINDDKPFIYVTENSIQLWGSPWNGKEKRGSSIIGSLEYCFFLQRSNQITVNKTSAWSAFKKIISHMYIGENPGVRNQVLKVAWRISNTAKSFDVTCNTSENVAEIVYNSIRELEEHYEI